MLARWRVFEDRYVAQRRKRDESDVERPETADELFDDVSEALFPSRRCAFNVRDFSTSLRSARNDIKDSFAALGILLNCWEQRSFAGGENPNKCKACSFWEGG